MMMGYSLLLLQLTLIGTVMGAPDRRPAGLQIVRSTDDIRSSLKSGQSLFVRSAPVDVGSLESPPAAGTQILILPRQPAHSPLSTLTDSAPISPRLQPYGNENRGEFSFVSAPPPSPKQETTSRLNSRKDDDLGRAIMKILNHLTGGAVHSLNGVTLPTSNLHPRENVHIFMATDPEERAHPPKPKLPIIMRPRKETHTFIAVSPHDLQVPFGTPPPRARDVTLQHPSFPPTYRLRPFKRPQGHSFSSNLHSGHEPGLNRDDGGSFGDQNSFVSNPGGEEEEGFHGTHLNTSPGGADTTIDAGASSGHESRAATLSSPFPGGPPPVRDVELFRPAPHSNSVARKIIPTNPNVQTFIPNLQNVQTSAKTNPAFQKQALAVHEGPSVLQADPTTQDVEGFPPAQANPAVQTFAPTVQNGPFIHNSATASALQNVHTGLTAQPFTATVQSSRTIPPVTNAIHKVQTLGSAVQRDSVFENHASTEQSIPFSAPVDQNVQTFNRASRAPAPADFPRQQIHVSVHGSQFDSSVGPYLTFPSESDIRILTPQPSNQPHQTSTDGAAVFDNSDGQKSGSTSDASGALQSPSFSASHESEDRRGLIPDTHTESDSTVLSNGGQGSSASTGNSLQTGTVVKGPGVPSSLNTGEQSPRTTLD